MADDVKLRSVLAEFPALGKDQPDLVAAQIVLSNYAPGFHSWVQSVVEWQKKAKEALDGCQ